MLSVQAALYEIEVIKMNSQSFAFKRD